MYKVEKDFEHKGLRCVITFGDLGHRCGYVGIPKTHILYGKEYDEYLEIKKEDIKGREVSCVFPLLGTIIDENDRIRVKAYFNCHGGITYSGGGEKSTYPIESDLWWFGFDCAHCDDGKDLDLAIEYFPEISERLLKTRQIDDMSSTYGNHLWTQEEVEKECKLLAEQLDEFEY